MNGTSDTTVPALDGCLEGSVSNLDVSSRTAPSNLSRSSNKGVPAKHTCVDVAISAEDKSTAIPNIHGVDMASSTFTVVGDMNSTVATSMKTEMDSTIATSMKTEMDSTLGTPCRP